jgi:hypothetical protein
MFQKSAVRMWIVIMTNEIEFLGSAVSRTIFIFLCTWTVPETD